MLHIYIGECDRVIFIKWTFVQIHSVQTAIRRRIDYASIPYLLFKEEITVSIERPMLEVSAFAIPFDISWSKLQKSNAVFPI